VNHLAPLGKSDHVVLDIVCNFNINVPGVKDKLNFSKGKYDDLRKSCNIDWSNIFDPAINSVDEMWDTFKNHIHDNSNLYIPLINDFASWRKNKWKRPLNPEIRAKITAEKHAWKNILGSKTTLIIVNIKIKR